MDCHHGSARQGAEFVREGGHGVRVQPSLTGEVGSAWLVQRGQRARRLRLASARDCRDATAVTESRGRGRGVPGSSHGSEDLSVATALDVLHQVVDRVPPLPVVRLGPDPLGGLGNVANQEPLPAWAVHLPPAVAIAVTNGPALVGEVAG